MVTDPRVIGAAYENGVNFFFLSADLHWPLYEATRQGLRDLLRGRPAARDAIVVGSVSYVAQPEFAVAPFREVIDAVPGLERLDVAVVGGVRGPEVDRELAFRAHRRSQLVPGVRATGASFHARTAALEWIERGSLDVAFVRYNTEHAGAERDLFPRLGPARRTAVFNFKSTAGYVPSSRLAELGVATGGWQPDVTDHYRFVLGRPELDGILCSPRSLRELEALGRALQSGPLAEEHASLLKTISQAHHRRLRCEAGTKDDERNLHP
jgi:hypothetical protein